MRDLTQNGDSQLLGHLRRLMNSALTPLGVRIERLEDSAAARSHLEFLSTDDNQISDAERELRRVRNVLTYTKRSGSPYSAAACESGYHSIELNGQVLEGQRNPAERFRAVPYDFSGKSVLDLGCNQGGMLFAIADRIGCGVGVDFDGRMVNAANRVKALRGSQSLHFYVFNLETEPLAFLGNFLVGKRVDVVFLLSVCMWIENWRDVINYSASIASSLLFESNGSAEQQDEQVEHLRSVYREVTQLQDESLDDRMQSARRLFLCKV